MTSENAEKNSVGSHPADESDFAAGDDDDASVDGTDDEEVVVRT